MGNSLRTHPTNIDTDTVVSKLTNVCLLSKIYSASIGLWRREFGMDGGSLE